MKASIITKYGSPDVLQLQDVPKPTPKDHEILIKIHAASLTPSDCAFLKGEPFIIKVIYGFAKPKFSIPGVELAGEVEAVGKDVRLFKRGDQVFGMSPDTFGAHAEYVCLPEDKVVVLKPTNMTYAETVGMCDGATTALTFLRDTAKIQSGQKVLINGASGAVGVYGVQLARYFGAEVTAVCSSANFEMVNAAGANHVIDYTQQDFTRNGQTYDVIFDAVGKRSFSQCKRSLTQKGIYLTTVPTLGIVWDMLRTAIAGSKKAKFVTAGLMQNKEKLNFLKDLCEAGHIKATIDRCYPLEDIAQAYHYVDTGHKKGNVIVTIAQHPAA